MKWWKKKVELTKWQYEFNEEDLSQAREGIRPFACIYWFGKDNLGHVALFESFGTGLIPLNCLEFEAHKNISTKFLAEMEFTHFHEAAVQAGLYLFKYPLDALNHRQPYPLTSIPEKPVFSDSNLLLQVSNQPFQRSINVLDLGVSVND